MVKVIFKCNYIKGGKSNKAILKNLVNYIATRDGVVKNIYKETKATPYQKVIIRKILRVYKESEKTLEYENYVKTDTFSSASEFINMVVEDNLENFDKVENYVDYIANRPRVQKIDTHGLFDESGKKIDLEKVKKEIGNHKGNVWLPIISLKREDAKRLGFEDAQAWKNLIHKNILMLSENLKIKQENFKWYGAFHDESHHPHIHLVCYSSDIKEGYLTEKGIEKIRATLTKDIFKNELKEIYEKQTIARDTLRNDAKTEIINIIKYINSSDVKNEKIQKMILELSYELSKVKGKKVYGYLPKNVKKKINSIVDEIGKIPKIKKAYKLWWEFRLQVLKGYSDCSVEMPKLSELKEFTPIKNIIISEIEKSRLALESSTNEDLEKMKISIQGLEMIINSIVINEKKYSTKNSIIQNMILNMCVEILYMFENEIHTKSSEISKVDSELLRKISKKKARLGHKFIN